MIKPKISIITVVYNAAVQLEKTLDNLTSLRYQNKELIVVDGGSDDGTKSVIEKHSLSLSSWISEKDDGIYDAMNKGLKMATGDYVWFINAGDTVYDTYTLDNIFNGSEVDFDVYYGDTLVTDSDGKILGLRKKPLPRKLSWYSLRRGMVVCHQSFIVKRNIAPLYSVKYRFSSDIDWMITVLKRANTIHNTRQIISKFEEGGISSVHKHDSLKERYHIMLDHYGYYVTLFYHFMFIFNVFKPRYRKFKGNPNN